MKTPTVNISAEQREFFFREGYLQLDSITEPEELETLRSTYSRLFEERTGWDDGNQFDLAGTDEGPESRLPQLVKPLRYAPQLRDTLWWANGRSIAEQIFECAFEQDGGCHMIYKPPHIGAATPWHQDQAYHDPRYWYRGINIWMPLDDATVENGCLWFVPGSHKLDVLPHHQINHDPRIHGLEVDDPEIHTANAVPCPVPAGGASLHHSYMLHYARPNTSPNPRRACTLTYRLPMEERETPLHFPWKENQQTARLERARTASERS